ncbi:MAG: hypothetical protein Q7S40_28560 [Opitutaceae bacterium]|nr:hypothetical protein [Opitutaceae bacterium]
MRTEPRYHLAPWQLRLYHNGKETYTFHETEADAVTAKKKAAKKAKKHGTFALGYDRTAQLKYNEATRILGPKGDIVEVARKEAARAASGYVARTVPVAVAEYLAEKQTLNRSRKHVQDIRQRLTKFAEAYPERDLETISADNILSFVNKQGPGARTKHNFYLLIACLFKHAARRDWVAKNPTLKIVVDADLPAKSKGKVEVLTIAQGEAIMRQIERSESMYIAWACLQYFLGVRDAEAERFRGEWIQRKLKRIVIPGWFLDGDVLSAVTKTAGSDRDDWVLDKIPPAFWAWVDRYPEAFAEGPIAFPSAPAWERARDAVIAEKHFDHWPRNGFRHSFATSHLSWLRDSQATSFLLRHRDAQKLWDHYFAKFVPEAEGELYLSLKPLPAE